MPGTAARLLSTIAMVVHLVVPLRGQEVPAGATIRIRFLAPIQSGRVPKGREVRVQSLSVLTVGRCVAVPAFTTLVGFIERSRAGIALLKRGSLRLWFDSIEVRAGRWAGISADLDSLEWSPRRVKGGTAFSGQKAVAFLAVEQLALVAGGIATLPVTGLDVAVAGRDRSRVGILAGEEAVLRLATSFDPAIGDTCDSVATPQNDLVLPQLDGRASNQAATVAGDPVNVVFLGDQGSLERAFAAADWLVAYRSTRAHLIRGVTDAIVGHQDLRAPVSPQYYGGQLEDMAFERASPSARVRHHIRFWRTDSIVAGDTVWVGAANEDVGLLVKTHGVPTHRIDSMIDRERELIVRELQAGQCVELRGHTRLERTTPRGTNTSGQKFVTDELAVVLRRQPCIS